MIRILLCFGLFFHGFIQGVVAQEKNAQTGLNYGKYFSVSGLMDYQGSKDIGVSPLNYRSYLYGGMAALDFENPRWDIAIDGGVGVGQKSVAKGDTYNSSATTFFYNGRFLYKIWDKNEGKFDFRAGLHFGGYSGQRVTPAFMNASVVWESINTFFASGKLNWRLSHEQSAGKFLFIRQRAGLRHIKFSTQLSLPLLHSVWRPDYAYVDDFSDGSSNVFDNNKLNFGGIRLNWRSDAYYYLLNGNVLRLTYLWDAQRSPGEINRLELSHHQLQLGMMIRLN